MDQKNNTFRADVLYNPAILGYVDYQVSNSVEDGFTLGQTKNSELFSAKISSYFDADKVEVDSIDPFYYKRLTVGLTDTLLQDYLGRMRKLDYDDTNRWASVWLTKTLHLIQLVADRCENRYLALQEEEEFKGMDNPGYKPQETPTDYCINVHDLYKHLVTATYYSFFQVIGNTREQLKIEGVIPYNFWGSNYKTLLDNYNQYSSYARDPLGRAITLFDDNVKWFSSEIYRLWGIYLSHFNSLFSNPELDPDMPREIQEIPTLFYNLFSDFDKRLSDSNNAGQHESLSIIWIISTMKDVFDKHIHHIQNSKHYDNIDFESYDFHVGECLSVLIKILTTFLNDIQAPASYHHRFHFHNVERESIEKIYDLMRSHLTKIEKSDACKAWDKNDFVNRVYTGDLKPYWVQGVSISVMKYNIKMLHKFAEDGWLKAVAESLGVSEDSARGKEGYDLPLGYEKDFPSELK